jgi:uncharacterized membrane protein YbhN (UPF0104 family)
LDLLFDYTPRDGLLPQYFVPTKPESPNPGRQTRPPPERNQMTNSGDERKTPLGDDGVARQRRWAGPLMLAILIGLVVAFVADIPLGSRFILVALALQPFNALGLWFVALRISLLCDPPVGVWPAAKAAALSGTLTFVLPGRLAELVKPVYLSGRCGVPPSRALAVLAVERFLDIVIVAALLAAGSLLLAHPALASSLSLWGSLALAGVLGAGVFIAWPQMVDRIVALLPFAALRRALDAFLTEVRGSMSGRRFVFATALGIGAWLASFALVYFAIAWFGSIPIGLSGTLLVFLAGVAGIAIAVAPAGLGTFEAALILALKLYGYGVGEALGLALLIRVGNAGFVPLIALGVILRERTGLRWLMARVKTFLARRA